MITRGMSSDVARTFVKTAFNELVARGHRYRDGVIDAAVSEAEHTVRQTPDNKELVRAISSVFEAFRISINPRWDGSIA